METFDKCHPSLVHKAHDVDRPRELRLPRATSLLPNAMEITQRAIVQPYQPASVREAMMHAATQTPAKTEVSASPKSIPRKCATMAPVQAPVPGNGTPTKAVTPTHRCWARSARVFRRALLSTGVSSRRIRADRSAPNIKGMGIILPTTQRNITFLTDMPIHSPTGTPPLSSIS